MKKLLKVLATACVATSLVAVTSCNNDSGNTDDSKTTDSATDSSNSSSTESTTEDNDPTKATYTVNVKSLSGYPVKDTIVSVRIDGKYKDITTGEDGVATFKADKSKSYVIDVEAPTGYTVSDDSLDQIAVANGEVNITLIPQLIVGEEQPESYSENDQFVDYTFNGIQSTKKSENVAFSTTETSLNTKNLFDSGKELIVLNFWYTTCSWCKVEFPLMFGAYEKYENKDKIQIIGINPGTSDENKDVISFLESCNYEFFTTNKTETAMISAFGISGYPSSVFIDRYGTICSIEGGAITTEDKWTALFDKYVGDSYTPTYEASGSTVIPTTVFPGSDALKTAVVSTEAQTTGDIKFSTEERDTYKKYNWPWNVTEKNGSTTISPTNQGYNSSYSIVYMDVKVPAGKALGIDYLVSCEDGDIFGVFVDGKKIFQDSGNQSKFTTKYIYAAGTTDETVTVEFIYYKDSKTALYDDTVYVKNIHFADVSTIGEFRSVRQASYGDLNQIDKRWDYYVKPVFNKADGYYHVGDENGPLLLAALVDEDTHFSNDSIASLLTAFTDKQKTAVDTESGKTYYSILTQYASYCNNSSITMMDLPTNGLTSVTEELARALKWLASEFGEGTDDNQWLEMCVYIDEYNVETPMGDPIQGLATFSALEAKISYSEDEFYLNAIKYDFPLVPRGYYWSFTPTKSGVYHLYGTDLSLVTDCFLYDENGNGVSTKITRDTYKSMSQTDTQKIDENFSYYMYYEAGKTYYCAPCFWDINDTENTLYFRIDYVTDTYQYLAQASEGVFTYEEASDGSIGGYISIANVDVKLGADNYYHPVVNGEIQNNEYIYADFKYLTSIFTSASLETLAKTKQTTYVLDSNGDKIQKKDSDNKPVVDDNGDPVYETTEVTVFNFAYDENLNKLTEAELKAWCLDGQDRTEDVLKYINEKMDTDENSVTYGTIKVDATLQNILQQLMNKFTFVNVTENTDKSKTYSPVDGSWLKLCYYMVTLGTKKSN